MITVMFHCGDGTWIEDYKLCDGYAHCSNLADESLQAGCGKIEAPAFTMLAYCMLKDQLKSLPLAIQVEVFNNL